MNYLCLDDNKICGNHKRCSECILDCEYGARYAIMRVEKKEENLKNKRIKRQLHSSCANCSMLQIINPDTEKLYCPYLVKDECLISSYIKQ